MGFSTENINEVKNLITDRRISAENEAHSRCLKAYEKVPQLKDIDEQFPRLGHAIATAFLNKTEDPANAIKKLGDESERLKNKRAELLLAAGLPVDYTDVKYFCKKCSDTGYLEFNMCECMRRELIKLGYKSSGLGALLEKQSFENFSLDYYTGDDRNTMQMNVFIAKNFVDEFGEVSSSLLLMGGTGLGKTHISTSIAAQIIEKGYDVLYVTSQNLISDFTFERFGRSYGDKNEKDTERYFDCDLLIIDDFGTEENNQFSTTVFYNLINTRTNKSLPTIINTNLVYDTIIKRYGDRIASRLFGEFKVLAFTGKDIRMQKLFDN